MTVSAIYTFHNVLIGQGLLGSTHAKTKADMIYNQEEQQHLVSNRTNVELKALSLQIMF